MVQTAPFAIKEGFPINVRRLTLTFAEVAKLYGTGVKRVREAAARGELPTTELGGKRFVLRAPIEERLGTKIDVFEDQVDPNNGRRAPRDEAPRKA